MSTKDRREWRAWMQRNPGLPPMMREYFTYLDRDLASNSIWSTTTTTTTSTTSTTSSSSSTSSSTSSTTTTSSTSSTTTTTTA